jgi:ankyrin repeat protein
MNLSAAYSIARSSVLLLNIFQANYDIFLAAQEDRVDDVAKYLNVAKVDIDLTDQYGTTLLNRASSYSSNEVMRFLLKKGADVDKADNRGMTPLHSACVKRYWVCGLNRKFKIPKDKQLKTIMLLLDNGAQVDIADKKGRAPLHHAAMRRNKTIIELLLQKEVNVNLADKDGEIPLHHALQGYGKKSEKGTEVVKLLLENGSEVNKASDGGETPLLLSRRSWNGGGKGTIQVLLEYGADIDEIWPETFAAYPPGTTMVAVLKREYPNDYPIFLAIVAKKKEKDLLQKKLEEEKILKQIEVFTFRNRSRIKMELIEQRDNQNNEENEEDNETKYKTIIKNVNYKCGTEQNSLPLSPIFSARSKSAAEFLDYAKYDE